MIKSELENQLKSVLSKIEKVPQDADVDIGVFVKDEENDGSVEKYNLEGADFSVHLDDDMYESVDYPEDTKHVRMYLFDGRILK